MARRPCLRAHARAHPASLARVDDYPLYVMRYYGRYEPEGLHERAASLATTMWSIAYDMTAGDIRLAVGRKYGQPRAFRLAMQRP